MFVAMRSFICIFLFCFTTNLSFASSDTATKALPTDAELAWLRSVIIPMKSVEMNSDDHDLLPLDVMVAGKEVIALGEVTHGSSDIYRMKDKIIKHLVEHDSFSVFAIEANMPEAFHLNDYIIGGKGDPKELIKGMLFWTWDTQEMLDLVEWMRSYNSAHSNKIIFTGFDMQAYKGPFTEITKLFKRYNHDTSYTLTDLRMHLESLDSARRKDYYVDGIKATDENRKYFEQQCKKLREFAKNIPGTAEREGFIQIVRVLEQYTLCNTSSGRDQYMAENLLWIRSQNPGSKIIVWAHNGHIFKEYLLHKNPMGYYVGKKLKDKYMTIGFTFHEGMYTAKGKDGLKAYPAQKSFPGTYEFYFHSIGQPLFLLDLRNIPKKDPRTQWLLKDQRLRWTGAGPMEQEFLESGIVGGFDLLIYIDTTRASTLLHEPKSKM